MATPLIDAIRTENLEASAACVREDTCDLALATTPTAPPLIFIYPRTPDHPSPLNCYVCVWIFSKNSECDNF